MVHQFRKKLRSGELLIGTMITLNSPEVAEIMKLAGYDWLFLDAEHGSLETLEMQRILQAAGSQTPCLVRVSISDEVPIKKALDIGAAGIIAPLVNSQQQAERVVRLAKYAPLGTRGVGLSRAHSYGFKFQEYLEKANEDITVVIQVEHIESVNNIERIAQVKGVDGVFVGPYDLSASLGILGKVNHPKVVAAIERVTEVCQDAGIPLGIFGISAKAVRPYMERGYTLIAVSADIMMLGEAGRQLLSQVKA